MVTRLIEDLKKLFRTFTYFRSFDETMFHNRIVKNIKYKDGAFHSDYDGGQRLTLEFNGQAHETFEGYYTGYFKGTIYPSAYKQKIIISNSNVTVTAYADDEGGFTAGDANTVWYDEDTSEVELDVTVNSIIIGDVTYNGLTTTYTIK